MERTNFNYIERTWAEINLDNMIESARIVRKELLPDCKWMVVLKSNGYGHGAATMAPILERECGADWFAVACLSEAIELRQAGVEKPILILGLTQPEYAGLLLKYDLTQTIGDLDYAKALSDQAVKAGGTVNCHIKINTGMNRLGFNSTDDPDETLAELEKIVEALGLPNLTCDALYSHLYNSTVYDDAGREECYAQYNRFVKMRYLLKQRGYTFPNCHICNSGGVINYPEMKLDMCRTGSLVCGVQPGEIQLRYPAFCHVLELKTRVALLREVKKGSCVGYSSNFIAGEDMKIAVVSCGYTDGYMRCNSNRGVVLIRGQRCRVIGNICMDMMMVDATHVPDVEVGDIVTVYGRDGEEYIPCAEAAKTAGTIEPEITTVIGRRVPRVYLRGGKVVKVDDYLLGGRF